MESQVFGILVVAAFSLLLVVSAGIGYLTLAEWRDRRRRDRALREERSPVSLKEGKTAAPRKAGKTTAPRKAGRTK